MRDIQEKCSDKFRSNKRQESGLTSSPFPSTVFFPFIFLSFFLLQNFGPRDIIRGI